MTGTTRPFRIKRVSCSRDGRTAYVAPEDVPASASPPPSRKSGDLWRCPVGAGPHGASRPPFAHGVETADAPLHDGRGSRPTVSLAKTCFRYVVRDGSLRETMTSRRATDCPPRDSPLPIHIVTAGKPERRDAAGP